MSKERMQKIGPGLWKKLHEAAARNEITPQWLRNFSGQIPCGPCKNDWLTLVSTNPQLPDESQFEWSVRMHNAVNAKSDVNKPIMSLADAKKLYSVKDPMEAIEVPPEITVSPEAKPMMPATLKLKIQTQYLYQDSGAAKLWEAIRDAIARREPVMAQIVSAPAQVLVHTLIKNGVDEQLMPKLSIGPNTQVGVDVGIVVNLMMPALPSAVNAAK